MQETAQELASTCQHPSFPLGKTDLSAALFSNLLLEISCPVSLVVFIASSWDVISARTSLSGGLGRLKMYRTHQIKIVTIALNTVNEKIHTIYRCNTYEAVFWSCVVDIVKRVIYILKLQHVLFFKCHFSHHISDSWIKAAHKKVQFTIFLKQLWGIELDKFLNQREKLIPSQKNNFNWNISYIIRYIGIDPNILQAHYSIQKHI